MSAIPAPAQVLHALAALWPPLWRSNGRRSRPAPISTPNVRPSTGTWRPVWCATRPNDLARLGHDAQEEDGEAYAFQTLPNNGLSLSYREDHLYVLRILKALEGQLPAPGAPRAGPSLAADGLRL